MKRISSPLIICVLILLCGCGLAQAQSGRRAKGKAPSTDAASKPAESAQSSKPSTPPAKQRLSLIVTLNGNTPQSASSPAGDTARIVFNAFVERLKDSSAFSVKPEKQMSRDKAVDMAKEQQEAHVVWLNFDDEMILSRTNKNPEIYVEYAVLMAETAKLIGKGKVYLRVYRPGAGQRPVAVGIPAPVPVPGSRVFPEASLQQAGREAADRIMVEVFGVTP
jgi:hypothetical protein